MRDVGPCSMKRCRVIGLAVPLIAAAVLLGTTLSPASSPIEDSYGVRGATLVSTDVARSSATIAALPVVRPATVDDALPLLWVGATRDTSKCMYEIPPAQQRACRALRSVNTTVYSRSWCPFVEVCVFWGAGYFNHRLTPEALLQAAESLSPSKLQSLASVASLFAIQSLGVLSELQHLRGRVAAHVTDHKLQSEAETREPATPRVAVNVQPIFKGMRVTVEPNCGAVTSARAAPCEPLTSLDIAALFYQRAVRSRTSSDPSARDIFVFCGDSTLRELFLRIVNYIRNGHPSPSPFFDLRSWSDIVYDVFQGGDQLRFFDSPFSRKKPKTSVLGGLEEQGSTAAGPHSGMPLFSLVFLFSKRTKEPRREVWASDLPHFRRMHLLVEGTLFWEPTRSSDYVAMWGAKLAHSAREVPLDFVPMTGAFLCELCRHHRHADVPIRIFGGPVDAADGPMDRDALIRLANDEAVSRVFNLQKNIELFAWLWNVSHFRASPLTRVAVLDKARLSSVPSLLPTDHIHLSCRIVSASSRDALLGDSALSPLSQWLTLLTRGGAAAFSNEDVAVWSRWFESQPRECDGLPCDKRPVDLPQEPQWVAAERSKKKSNRFVTFTTDRRGCHDVGDATLVLALISHVSMRDDTDNV